jgi:hypothetical protein
LPPPFFDDMIPADESHSGHPGIRDCAASTAVSLAGAGEYLGGPAAREVLLLPRGHVPVRLR